MQTHKALETIPMSASDQTMIDAGRLNPIITSMEKELVNCYATIIDLEKKLADVTEFNSFLLLAKTKRNIFIAGERKR